MLAPRASQTTFQLIRRMIMPPRHSSNALTAPPSSASWVSSRGRLAPADSLSFEAGPRLGRVASEMRSSE